MGCKEHLFVLGQGGALGGYWWETSLPRLLPPQWQEESSLRRWNPGSAPHLLCDLRTSPTTPLGLLLLTCAERGWTEFPCALLPPPPDPVSTLVLLVAAWNTVSLPCPLRTFAAISRPAGRVPRSLGAAGCLHERLGTSLSTKRGREVLLPGPEIDFLLKT